MSQYNRPLRFGPDNSGYGNARNSCPPRYGVNCPPGPRYNCPTRYGPPPRWPMGYAIPPFHPNPDFRLESPPIPPVATYFPNTPKDFRGDSNSRRLSPASNYTTSTTSSSLSSPRPRVKGPRTPPGTPPPDVPTIENRSSADNDYVNRNRNENCWQPRDKHQKYSSKQRFKKQQRDTRGRRNSLPLPYRDEEDKKSTSEAVPPSAINIAVQSYLLQMITQHPHSAQTPPPLPPTPTRPPTPPPPPASDEENWDTPSETSNDARDFNDENPNKNNGNPSPSPSNEEGNFHGSLNQGTDGVPFGDLGAEETIETLSINNTNSLQNKSQENSGETSTEESNNFFRIKLPPQMKSVENKVRSGFELSIDIPNVEVSKNPEKSTTILEIVSPKNKNQSYNEEEEEMESEKNKNEKNRTDSPKVITKSKRKKSSTKSNTPSWSLELAEKALQIEQDIQKDFNKENVLLLRFPDPPLTREIVKDFHKDIETVHFHYNPGPRYCFVNLKEGCNVDTAIENISKIPFGSGTIKAELRNNLKIKVSSIKPENIDPFTLYVGNLPLAIPCKVLKEHFPGASRINIGFAQRRKNTRYAFIQYHKMEDAADAFRRMKKFEIDGRTLIIRFKRLGSAAQLEEDGENITELEDHNENISQDNMKDSTKNSPRENYKDENHSLPQKNSNLNSNDNETILEREILSIPQEHRIQNSEEHVQNAEKEIGVLKAKDLTESIGSLTSSAEMIEENNSNPLQCLTFESETKNDNEFVDAENTGSIGNTNNFQTNILESQTREVEKDKETVEAIIPLCNNIKTEETESNEKILFSMPRLSYLPNCVNKTEMDENFEFFSDKAKHCSKGSKSIISGSKTFDTNVSEKSPTSHQSLAKGIQLENEIDEDLIDEINDDINLLKESLICSTNNDKQKNKNITNQISNTLEDNSDKVPENALLLRRNSRLMSYDNSSYTPYHNDHQSLMEIQSEKSQKKSQNNESSITNHLIASRKRKFNTEKESLLDIKSEILNSTQDEDNDLVPADCALNLYKKSVDIFDLTIEDDPILQIKHEAETEDLFSLPKRTAKGRRNNEEKNNEMNLDKNLKGPKNNINVEKENVMEKNHDSKSIGSDETLNGNVNDEDVIIVSCNLISKSLTQRQDLCKDLIQIKEEQINSPTNIEKSFFGKYKKPSVLENNLDRLFALLESNSDDEL